MQSVRVELIMYQEMYINKYCTSRALLLYLVERSSHNNFISSSFPRDFHESGK